MKAKMVESSACHAMSNGMVERFSWVLRDSISHYVDSASINWDVVLSFFIIAYRATAQSTTNTIHFIYYTAEE